MKLTLPVLLLFLLICGSSSKSQSALSSKTNSETIQYTVSDNSGLSIKNNGTLSYSGPLNQLSNSDSENLPKASLHVDEREISAPESLITATINNPNYNNTISNSLSNSIIPADRTSKKINLVYEAKIPSVVSIKFRQSSVTQETVDSQSLSIFPSGSFSF